MYASKLEELKELLDNPEQFMLQAGGEYELISEMSFLRSLVKYKNYKIVLYGAGAMGEYIERWLRMENVPIEFVIDNNRSKSGTLCGKTIIHHSEDVAKVIENSGRGNRYLAVIATSYYEKEAARISFSLYKNGIDEYIYAFDPRYGIPPYKYKWASYYTHHKDEILYTYNLLQDSLSQEIYVEFIKANITNCSYAGLKRQTKEKYFECYTLLEEEVFLNIGSFTGDTIFYFVEKCNEKFKKIYAIEGEAANYERLVRNLQIFPSEIRERIETEHVFLDGSNISSFTDKKPTLINMDIEGAELAVIRDLEECIVQNRPVLAICAYHKAEDIVEIPKAVCGMVDDYQLYFRKYAASYSSPLGNGESVLYAVPKERVIK